MNDAIDLESAIMVAWQTSEDIDLLFKHYCDSPRVMTEDEVANALLGIKILHDMRCEALMDDYCHKMELNEYATEEQKAAREDWFDKILTEARTKKKGSKSGK